MKPKPVLQPLSLNCQMFQQTLHLFHHHNDLTRPILNKFLATSTVASCFNCRISGQIYQPAIKPLGCTRPDKDLLSELGTAAAAQHQTLTVQGQLPQHHREYKEATSRPTATRNSPAQPRDLPGGVLQQALTLAGLKLTFLALPCSSPETAGWLLKPCLTFRAVSSS